MARKQIFSISEIKQEIARANGNLRRSMAELAKMMRSSEERIAQSKQLLEEADALLGRGVCDPTKIAPPGVGTVHTTNREAG